MAGPPRGPAFIANVLAQQERLEADLRRLEVFEGILARPHQLPDRCVLHARDIPRREIARPQPPRQWHGIAPVGLHAVARFLGNARRGYHPTKEVLLRQVPIPPVPTRPRFVDEVPFLPFRLQLPHQLIDIALPGPARPQQHALRLTLLRDIGD